MNLERAMKLGDRLGGHLVSGHIDTIGKIESVSQVGESTVVAINFDKRFDHLVIEKGSIAINGLSLTINNEGPGWLEVNLIPHTIAVTTARSWGKGEDVNLEFDMIGKYLNKISRPQAGNVSIDLLKESGW
jgi:riboflavin synthase